MNKQSIIGLILIFVVMMGYAYFTSPSMTADPEGSKKTNTVSSNSVDNSIAEATILDTNVSKNAPSNISEDANSSTDALAQTEGQSETQVDKSQPFYNASIGENEIFKVENDVFEIDFQTLGGRISTIKLKDYLTYTYDSLYLFNAQNSDFYIGFFANNRHVRTDNYFFSYIAPDARSISGEDSLKVKMRLYPQISPEEADTSKYIEWVYTVYGNKYDIGINLNIVGMQDIIAANTTFIDLVWRENLGRLEKALNMEQTNTTIHYKSTNGDVDNLKETKDDAQDITTPVKWIAFKQQFFSTILVADKSFESAQIEQIANKDVNAPFLKDMKALIGIPYENGVSQSIDLSLYAGPNKYRILRDYDMDLDRLIPLGWGFFLLQWINRFAVIPTFDLLDSYGLNYGLIILLLTILLKIILFPITYKSYLSSAKMRVIQPEVEIINKKYPKQDQAMEKQKAVMALYKKAGVSPMSGCIPMLMQFPILIAMFRFFPASIELRQQPFLWATDLSSYDSVLNLPFNIPFYGDHVSLFALLMAVTNVFYTRMTMKQTASTNQMPGMKMMMYIMPIMFLGLLNSYSSALNYYYCLSTCLTFFQMWIIRKFVHDEKVMALIQENKKKPVKKSKFQQRLENMAKQQQQGLRQRQNQQKK